MFEEISFPEHEYESIQKIGKYKAGELYTAPWGDVLKIDEVKTYRKVSDRPFYDEMSDDEKAEIRTYSEDIGLPYEFIKFSRSSSSKSTETARCGAAERKNDADNCHNQNMPGT